MVIFSRPKPMNGIAGSYDTSMSCVSWSLHAVFHSGFTIYIPTQIVGFYFPYILCRFLFFLFILSLYFVDLFNDGHCDQRDVVVNAIDWMITDVECVFMCFCYFFVMCFCYLLFYTSWVQFTSWICFPESCCCMEFFSNDLPQDISWGWVSLTALSDLGLLRTLQHLFYGLYINLNQLMALCPLKLSFLLW